MPVAAGGHKAYTTLVQGENDLVGLIAYSLYKSDKLDFVAKHHADTGSAPTSAEVLVFCRSATLAGPVSAYRAKATYLLQEMYDDLLEDKVAELQRDYQRDLVAELKQAHPFWEGVWQHVIAGIAITAFLGLVAVIYYGSHAGFKQMFSNIFDLPAAESKSSSH